MDHRDLLFQNLIDHAVSSDRKFTFKLFAYDKNINFLAKTIGIDNFNMVKFAKKYFLELCLHQLCDVVRSVSFIASECPRWLLVKTLKRHRAVHLLILKVEICLEIYFLSRSQSAQGEKPLLEKSFLKQHYLWLNK